VKDETAQTIRFTAKLTQAPRETECALTLPSDATASFSSTRVAFVEGLINGFPFRAPLNNGKKERSLKFNEAITEAAGAEIGDTVAVEITRLDDAPELLTPSDLSEALTSTPAAKKTWAAITPMARRDWILWLGSTKQPQTRATRIKKACSMLTAGKRRVCCFGGLNWLTKDHPSVPTWLPLPD
jgi:hypothetical protein